MKYATWSLYFPSGSDGYSIEDEAKAVGCNILSSHPIISSCKDNLCVFSGEFDHSLLSSWNFTEVTKNEAIDALRSFNISADISEDGVVSFADPVIQDPVPGQ